MSKKGLTGMFAGVVFWALAASGQITGKILPGPVFQKSFPSEIKGVFLAKTSGEVLVYGDDWVEYYECGGKLLWRSKGFKFVCGPGVSRDGSVVLYQTSPVPKTDQTLLNLTVHIVNRGGQELLSKPNPYRYFTSILSSRGNYIVFGDPMAKKIYVYDQNLNFQWERETYLWYINFDPEDQFVFDSAFGLILNPQGRRVWELPSGAKFLGMSSNAEILLSQRFLTARGRNQIYLTTRTTAQQVVLEGFCAGVSYDGSLTAFQDLQRQIHVYRTRELLEKMAGNQNISPLWSGEMALAKILQFSTDNSKLFIYGLSGQKFGKIILIDLAKSKKIWDKEWVNPPVAVFPTEDNRYLAVQLESQMEYYLMR